MGGQVDRYFFLAFGSAVRPSNIYDAGRTQHVLEIVGVCVVRFSFCIGCFRMLRSAISYDPHLGALK